MNLLKDQREVRPQKTEDIFEDSASLDNVFTDSDDDFFDEVPEQETVRAAETEQFEPQPIIQEQVRFDSYAGGSEKKKRSLVLPLGIAATFVFLIVLIVAFFKPKAENPPIQDQLANKPETTQQDQVQTTPAQEQSSERLTQQPSSVTKGVQIIGHIMSTLLGSIPSSSHLSTLFIDDGSFSIEVSGPAVDLQKYQTDLKGSLTSAKVSHGAVSGGKTLISGTFPMSKEIMSGSSVSKDEVMAGLTELAKSAGVQVIEKSSKDLNSGGSTKSEIFLKVSGSVNQCQDVLTGFADKNWNVQISKVLLLPTNQQRANLVLRFLLHT